MATYVSENITYGQTFLLSVIAALKTAPTNPLVNMGKVRLTTQAGFNPQPLLTIAELSPNEANYSGYTAGGIALTLSSPVLLGTGAVGNSQAVEFIASTASPFVPSTLTGYWIDDGTNVIAMEAFSTSIPIAAAYDFLALVLQLPLQLAQATS